jgi:hypothetical protein
MTNEEYTALVAETEGHTPGPWYFNTEQGDGHMHNDAVSTHPFAEYMGGVQIALADDANARLIAAAPALLADVGRLRGLLKFMLDHASIYSDMSRETIAMIGSKIQNGDTP